MQGKIMAEPSDLNGRVNSLVEDDYENNDDSPYPDYSQKYIWRWISQDCFHAYTNHKLDIPLVRNLFVLLFLLLFLIGVTGNGLVCIIIWANKMLTSSVNYYILNLGICDLLISGVVLPLKLMEIGIDSSWSVLNKSLCTVSRYLDTTVIFTTVYTLVALCVERYFAIVYPFRMRALMSRSRIKKMLVLLWTFPCILAAPNLLYPSTGISFKLNSTMGLMYRKTCMYSYSETFRFYYYLILFVFIYALPTLVICFTGIGITRILARDRTEIGRHNAGSIDAGRNKVSRMVLVIAAAFILCWSPYFLVTQLTQFQEENYMHHGQFFFTMLCINLACFANSCINPVACFFLSSNFREGFRKLGSVFDTCWSSGNTAREGCNDPVAMITQFHAVDSLPVAATV